MDEIKVAGMGESTDLHGEEFVGWCAGNAGAMEADVLEVELETGSGSAGSCGAVEASMHEDGDRGIEADDLEAKSEVGVGSVGAIVSDGSEGAGSPSCFQQSGSVATNSSSMCHLHAHCFSPSPSSVSPSCVGSSVGVGGAPGWAVGRLSARLSSRWCCPGCGLYGDGTLCMNCDMHGVGNSCADPDLNLRLGGQS